MIRRTLPALAAALLSLLVVLGPTLAQDTTIPPPNANCAPFADRAPAGQQFPTSLEPSVPIWCYAQPAPVGLTRTTGQNDWVDTWDNDGPAIQTLRDGEHDYRRFDQTDNGRIAVGYFVNVNHWMLDVGDISPFRLSGGSLLSPNRTFLFENGRLVVEADMAAGSDGMSGADTFYEIDISPARAPTGVVVDPLYGYGQFGGIGALGCRFERADDGGHIVCAMYDASTRDAGGTDVTGGPPGRKGRVWETQGVGSEETAPVVEGGYPGWPIPNSTLHASDFWRQCKPNQLDLYCRDRMRLELTKDSLHIYANAALIYRVEGLFARNPATGADNRIPDAWLRGGVAVYATSWINGGQHHATRWHWDRIAVNPHSVDGSSAPPSPHPNYCFGRAFNTCPPELPNASPTSTVTPAGTSTPTPTPTPTRPPATATAAAATATAQATMTQQPTATATATPSPTSAPTATATVEPTQTPVATPAPLPRTCTILIAADGTVSGFCPPSV